MKKRKIKKGIMLLSMVMVIISTVLPVTSSATEYEVGNVLYEIYNADVTALQEAFPYIYENVDKINEVRFISIQTEENGEIIYPKEGNKSGENPKGITLYPTSGNTFPQLQIIENGRSLYYINNQLEKITPYKITIYNIIEIVPTPPPDERTVNLLNETGNGIGTVLTWVGNLWEGIVSGDMSAILPIFAIFVIIPIILLVIKIIRKTTWGN